MVTLESGGLSGIAMLTFDRADLHSALGDPAVTSISFLNEIMGRHPDAISFAPGAPHLSFVDDLDLIRYVDAFVDHAGRTRGLDPARARALLYEYGPTRGLINDLVADALRADAGIDVAPEAIVITVGAQEAMVLVLKALFTSPGDVLAVIDPCYVGITGAARVLDIDIVAVEESDTGLPFDQLAAQCAAARAAGRRIRALYVAPDHSNPSGTLLDLPSRERLLSFAAREDIVLLEDNAYGFTAVPGAELPSLKALDREHRVVCIGTFAKICMPGARVGFVVADQRVRDGGPDRLLAHELSLIKSLITVNTSPMCQAVIGGMLLEHGGSLASLGRAKAVLYRRNLGLLVDALDRHVATGPGTPVGVSWNRPSGGFFVRVRLPVRADAALVEVSASTFGVLWTPMAPFYRSAAGDKELRLSCSYLDPVQIDEGVRRLACFLRSVAA